MARRCLSVLLTMVLLVSCIAVLFEAPEAEAAGTALKITGSKVVAAGKKVKLEANKTVKWTSSNKKIATVDKNGNVKGKKAGTVKITAKATDGSKKTWKMTVTAKPVKSVRITADVTELDLGGTKKVKLKATAAPAEAAQKFTWKSSDEKVAKVSSSGTVTAQGAGKAKITATAMDGSKKKKSITITVKDSSMEGKKIGIALPTKALNRWKTDGETMKNKLTAAGCEVILKYADNKASVQTGQVEAMIAEDCDVLIIGAVDGGGLSSALAKVEEKGIKVIAYERLITQSGAVSYYISYNATKVGTLQGNHIRSKLGLDSNDGPFYLEITAGDPADSTGVQFFNGAMNVLKPYINSGKLVVRSGQTTMEHVGTPGWIPDNAKDRAVNILDSYYENGMNIDAWLCINDSTAQGVISALNSDYTGNKWPIITGLDCEKTNIKYIKAGKQSMSVFIPYKECAAHTITMVKQILAGKTVETNSKTSNGAISVPTYLYSPVAVEKGTIKKYLIDPGYYTEEDLN